MKGSQAGTCLRLACVPALPQGTLLPAALVSEPSSKQVVCEGQDIVTARSSS